MYRVTRFTEDTFTSHLAGKSVLSEARHPVGRSWYAKAQEHSVCAELQSAGTLRLRSAMLQLTPSKLKYRNLFLLISISTFT